MQESWARRTTWHERHSLMDFKGLSQHPVSCSHGQHTCIAMCPAPVPVAALRVLQARGRWNLAPVEGGPRPVQVTVRRDALLEDAFRALAGLGSNVKARLMVGGHGSCCVAA
jgi:hypothetical protein